MNDLEQLQKLANGMIDGTASAADCAQLSNSLRKDAKLRDAYLNYLDTHAALCWEFRNLLEPTVRTSQAPESAGTSAPSWQTAFATLFPWSVVVIVAAFAVAVTYVWTKEAPPFEKEGITSKNRASRADLEIAEIVDRAGAKFAIGRAPEKGRFGRGQYDLLEGVIHMRFATGADLVLAGPARFDVTDSLHMTLVYGKVRAIVPPTAAGFTIATPGADYVDIGTEFGLSVEREDGASDLYVFDGQVNVSDPRSGKVISEVFEGESARHVNGVAEAAPIVNVAEFPDPGAIGLTRWQQYEQRLRQSEGLLAFFPFQAEEDESLLVNLAPKSDENNQRIPDGRINGARWVAGRWPGKGALLYDRDSDFVEINIPGDHQEMTIAVWLKVESLDFELNTILNSDGAHRAGGVHFQLGRQGSPRGGVLQAVYSQTHYFGKFVPIGKWTHVALVISTLNHTHRIFVNGELAFEREASEERIIRPGSCRLGNWSSLSYENVPRRALRGRIDELEIWGRAIPEGELKEFVEIGWPVEKLGDERQNSR